MNELYNIIFEKTHDYVAASSIYHDIIELTEKYGRDIAIEKFKEFVEDYTNLINNTKYYDQARIKRCEENIWYWNIAIIACKKEKALIRKNKLTKIKKIIYKNEQG